MARKAKGSVVLFEQTEVSPPCRRVCAVCTFSDDDIGDTCTADDENGADAAGKGVLPDNKNDLVDVLLTVGKRRWGRT